MPEGQIFVSLNLPGWGASPSTTSVQWSEDGQLILSTKSTIYILTPDLGINFDDVSLLKTEKRIIQETEGDTIDKTSFVDIGWYKNMISLEKETKHQWPLETPEWSALSLGSLDVSWRMATVSPSNVNDMTIGSGCLLVTLNTNLELVLWRATKNHLKEVWSKVQDITSTLKELRPPRNINLPKESVSAAQALQAQVNCLSWSQQACFSVQPAPQIDGSLLALGSRDGSLILMRYDGSGTMHCDLIIRLSDNWITHLAWGRWISDQPLQVTAYLACGLADGTIKIVRIQQQVEQTKESMGSIKASAEVLENFGCDLDGRSITAMSWVDRFEHEKPTLFYASPGYFYFYRPSLGTDEPMNSANSGNMRTALRVQAQKTSLEASSMSPVSGISRIEDDIEETVIVSLFDGSLHIIRGVCNDPVFIQVDGKIQDILVNEAEQALPNSTRLSLMARRAFVKTEPERPTFADVGRIKGSTSFDELGTLLWTHERNRPSDLNFLPDAKRSQTIIVMQTLDDQRTSTLLKKHMRRVVGNPMNGRSPLAQLRTILFHLRRADVFSVSWQEVLQILATDILAVPSIGIVPHYNSNAKSIRHSLSLHLYGWSSVQSLRLRLTLADHCWVLLEKISQQAEVQEQFGAVAQVILNGIARHTMLVIMKHAKAALPVLNEKDKSFIMRIVTHCLSPSSPEDLKTEANALSIDIGTNATMTNYSDEPCPACRAPIPFDNLLTAICPAGHSWSRCSVTTFILSTPLVRTCISCTRKAFLAPSSLDSSISAFQSTLAVLPESIKSWFVEELLEATRFCLFCGNRFVRIL